MLLLHVWGSAFGLPSIDAECLAVITYLHNALPSSAWRLVPSNDPAVSPSNLLPALNHDGVWTSGYLPIVNYLVSNSLCHDLDEALSPLQRTDTIAYSAYLGAHAAPLVDLSLYVSAANWSATTRPAYSSLLSFPLTWTVPTLIRAEAIRRAEHLGLAELDTDFDPNGGFTYLQEEMTPEQAAAIRLFGLTEDCLTVLDDFLPGGNDGDDTGRPRFFPGTTVSSLDCLAFGHLALMQKPPVPRSFLRDWLESKTPRLHRFVDDMMTACISARGDLPWTAPDAASPMSSAARILDSVMRHVPSIGDHYATEMRSRAEQGRKGLDQRTVLLAMGALITGVAASYGIQTYRAMQPFGAPTQTWQPRRLGSRLSEFGELGSMLSSAMGPVPGGNTGWGTGGHGASGQLVETDSEVD
ncbi:Metaxin-3-like protein [Cladobotryum mycophilum]|uniref:Metaxin-3-like protein n=1 Tax=Cladobotryum mycophilum TaxID=491253 RepID=A0ABR0SLK3_9HYPO